MTPQLVFRQPGARQKPLLTKDAPASHRFAEFAGGTTAECAAICCCCPCGLVNFVVLTFVKLPARLCRRAIKKKKRQKGLKNGLLPAKPTQDSEPTVHPVTQPEPDKNAKKPDPDSRPVPEPEPDSHPVSEPKVHPVPEPDGISTPAPDMPEEMWEKFCTGFWRNPSETE